MAAPHDTHEDARQPLPRGLIVFLGALVGAMWGGAMWGLAELLGRDSGGRGLAYLLITTAMLGAGVAAIFGAVWARRAGERISPRVRRRRRRG